ncbi:MAG: CYTH domain-containing protein [Eubacteriales bacterium]|nr:CYTH domain-containing protein [Eubacteriales bacterium]
MEIERKYLVPALPEGYEKYPFHQIEQAYLCTEPVVRIRRQDEEYYLTYKGKGLLAREEYNLPLTRDAYHHLLPKADGIVLTKRRYLIPLEEALSAAETGCLTAETSGLTIELDVFSGKYEGLVLAEVEFDSLKEAEHFTPPAWFGRDVTMSGEYQNSKLSLDNK